MVNKVKKIKICIKGVLRRMKKMWGTTEGRFLIIGLILGIVMMAIVPPGHVPDEGAHFMRAYGVANGELIAGDIDGSAVGGEIPVESDFILSQADKKERSGVYNDVLAELGREVSGETRTEAYNTSAVYNFVCYIPQAVGILIGKILKLPVMWMIYLARLCNFVVWLVLTYFAVKLSPYFKKIIIFVSLFPITLQEAVSLSPDALTMGAGVLMVAYTLYLTFSKKGLLNKMEKIILCLLAIVMGLCKIVYFPLVLIYLMIPVERFGSKRKKWIQVWGTILIAVLISLGWLAMSFGLIVETNPGVDAKAQLFGVLMAPLRYVKVILMTVDVSLYRWLREMLGMQLTSFGLDLPTVIFFVSLSIFMALLVQRDEKLNLRRFDRWLAGGIFGVIALMIMTSLYVQWTPYGELTIGGIQGRYFLPILLLVPIIFCKTKGRSSHVVLVTERTVLCYSVLVNVIAFITIFAQNA